MSDCRVHELHRQTGLIELLLALGHVYTLQFTEQACGEINDGTIHLFKNWKEKIYKIEQDYLEISLQVLKRVVTSKQPEIPPQAILHTPNSSFSWNEATFFSIPIKSQQLMSLQSQVTPTIPQLPPCNLMVPPFNHPWKTHSLVEKQRLNVVTKSVNDPCVFFVMGLTLALILLFP